MGVRKEEVPFWRLKERVLDCCRDATQTPPMSRTAAEPTRIHHRYFCSGSGASIGGPNPPPGRLLESARGAALPAEFSSLSPERCVPLCWPVSRVASPEMLNASFCPPLVFAATRTLASGWFG